MKFFDNEKIRSVCSYSFWFGAPKNREAAYCVMRETGIVIGLYIAYFFVFTYSVGQFGVVTVDVVGLAVVAVMLYVVKRTSVLVAANALFLLYSLVISGIAIKMAVDYKEVGNGLLISVMLLYVAYRSMRAVLFLRKRSPSKEKEV